MAAAGVVVEAAVAAGGGAPYVSTPDASTDEGAATEGAWIAALGADLGLSTLAI